MATLAQVKQVQPEWFSRSNKRMFGDVEYRLLHDTSGNPYLVRSTYAWTDMFGAKPRLHYRVNTIDAETLEIGSLVEQEFRDYAAAKDYVKGVNHVR